MSISVELLWSNDPLPINEIIENPTVVVNLPIGGTIITSNVTQSYVDDQDALLQTQIDTKADQVNLDQTNAQVELNRLSILTKADAVDLSMLAQLVDTKADADAVNQSLSLKADLVGGVIPSFQLPSYVDDVLSFVNLASFPVTGEGGKIYIAEDVNKTYRWSGSSYVEIGGGGVALGETSSTAYRGDRGKIAYDHSQSQGNPHNTTTSEINEGTKLFFTEPRVRQTVLTGLNTNTATPALATDQLLVAIGKLQAQINNTAPPVWVSAASIGTVHQSITGMEFAKIDGNLWVRGYYNWVGANLPTSTVLFTLTSANYRIDTPNSAVAETPVGLFSVCTNEISIQQAVVKCIVNNRYYFKIYPNVVFNQSVYGIIQPTAIGRLITP